MPSKLEALTARVNEADERISELEDGLVEEKIKIESGLKKIHMQECTLREGRLGGTAVSICLRHRA